VVGGALFKRTEEEKRLSGWAPAPGRGIRTVGITDSAIKGPPDLDRHPNYVLAAFMASGT
jgi:hypothetical protein